MNTTHSHTEPTQSLRDSGHAALGPVLSDQEIDQLQREVALLFNQQERMPDSRTSEFGNQFRVPVFFNGNWSVLINPLGLSDRFDALFCKMVTAPAVTKVIENVLGKGYKLQGASLRRSEIADSGLKLHLDAPGQLELMILIEDAPDASGTTGLLPAPQAISSTRTLCRGRSRGACRIRNMTTESAG